MPERRINWGPGDGTGKYRTEDTGAPGDFVVAEDTNGATVLLSWNDTAGQWEYGGPVEMGGNDISNVGTLTSTAVNTEKASVTNETFVRATRSSNSSSTTADTFINAFDNKSKDVRGELNSSQQFVPDESGEYIIIISADIRGNTSAGDELSAKVEDTDASTSVEFNNAQSPGAVAQPTFVFTSALTAGRTYEIQVRNDNSSFVVDSTRTKGQIIRSVVA